MGDRKIESPIHPSSFHSDSIQILIRNGKISPSLNAAGLIEWIRFNPPALLRRFSALS
jgi:hypothetical protein